MKKIATKLAAALVLGLLAACGLGIAESQPAGAADVRSTEDFLNTLGVNTHLQGLTPSDPWNTNIHEIAKQLDFLGVRIVRDWIYRSADGRLFKDLQNAWRSDGRFWTSIVEGSPVDQRKSLALSQAVYRDFPGLICAMGGPNEEDDDYPQKRRRNLAGCGDRADRALRMGPSAGHPREPNGVRLGLDGR